MPAVPVLVSGVARGTVGVELTGAEVALFAALKRVAEAHPLRPTVRVAGGWVRDRLLGKPSHDIDVALDTMTGEAFAEAVATAEPGSSGRVTVIAANPEQSKHLSTATAKVFGFLIDFVNLRSEEYASDSRIPTVTFGTALEDAERRDFTVNALFFNVSASCIEDFTGHGMDDLRAGVLRTPLPPLVTFHDDPLRVLRAVRFASRLGFHLVPDAVAAARAPSVQAALGAKISRERVGNEVDQMLSGRRPLAAARLLASLGLLPAVIPLPPAATGGLCGALQLPGGTVSPAGFLGPPLVGAWAAAPAVIAAAPGFAGPGGAGGKGGAAALWRCLGPLAGLSAASLDELESLTAVRNSPAPPQLKPPTTKKGGGGKAAGGSGEAAPGAAAAASAVVAAPAAPPPPPLVPDSWYELAAPTLEALGLVCAALQQQQAAAAPQVVLAGGGGGGEAPPGSGGAAMMSDGPPPEAAAATPATAVDQLSSGAALAAALLPSGGGGAPPAEGWEIALPPPFLALSVPCPLPLAQRVAAWHAETGRDALDRRPAPELTAAAARRTAEEARPDALESSPLSEDARRSLLLAALLAPLATLGLRRSSSGRPEPLATAVVVECLKRRVSDGDAVASLLAGATALRALVRALAQGAAPGATLPPLASGDAFALCRAELARILRGVGKEQWPLSLLLAAALDAVPALYPASATAPPGAGELAAALWPVLGTYAHLGRLVHAWSLDGAWARRHVIEGRRMMAEMPGVAGPALGRVMDEQMRWQLLHPGAGEAEILAHLRGFAAQVPVPASAAPTGVAAVSAASAGSVG